MRLGKPEASPCFHWQVKASWVYQDSSCPTVTATEPQVHDRNFSVSEHKIKLIPDLLWAVQQHLPLPWHCAPCNWSIYYLYPFSVLQYSDVKLQIINNSTNIQVYRSRSAMLLHFVISINFSIVYFLDSSYHKYSALPFLIIIL